MSLFYTTANLHHITPLPAGTNYSTAVSALHDHGHLIQADPEYSSHEELPRSTPPTKPFLAPADSDTKRYRVVDHMAGLPKGLGLPSTISFECEITNVEGGIDWIVKAPMGLVQNTTWRILKRAEVQGAASEINELVEDGGEWALVEDVKIEANRLLAGTVKGKCEANWRGIQKKFVEHVKGLEGSGAATAT